MASPTQWTWVWVNSGSWWWTGRPGVLRFMRWQRVRHDWATELNWTELNGFNIFSPPLNSVCSSYFCKVVLSPFFEPWAIRLLLSFDKYSVKSFIQSVFSQFLVLKLCFWGSGAVFVVLLLLLLLSCLYYLACGILAPQPGIKPMPSVLEAQNLNHWTTREVSNFFFFYSMTINILLRLDMNIQIYPLSCQIISSLFIYTIISKTFGSIIYICSEKFHTVIFILKYPHFSKT